MKRHVLRRARRHSLKRIGKGRKLCSDQMLKESIELLAFGQLGCTLLRGFGVRPLELLGRIHADSREVS